MPHFIDGETELELLTCVLFSSPFRRHKLRITVRISTLESGAFLLKFFFFKCFSALCNDFELQLAPVHGN
jgi:hypothetical protein